jgi:hypothetical protein
MMDDSRDSRAAINEFLSRVLCAQASRSEWESWDGDSGLSLARSAQSEGVAGLVFWMVQEAGWLGSIPEAVCDALRRQFYAQAAQNALLFSELDRLLDAFTQAQVPVIVLKGAALAREVYPDPALRPMNDLDLLVRAQDLQRTTAVMRSGGYKKLKSSYHLVFQGGPQSHVAVEVHWELITDGIRRDGYLQGLWQRALSWNAAIETSALRLHPMDNLLSLSAHLIWQHPQAYARLVWFYDLYLLLKRYMDELDWDLLAELALQAGWGQPLYHALAGVEQRFGWQAPGGFLQALCDGDARARLPAPAGRERERRMAAWMWAAMAELGWGQRLRGALELAMPHPEYMRWRYKLGAGWVAPLYYPVRWWQLLRDGLGGWLR